MSKRREYWCQIPLRVKTDLGEEIKRQAERTGLTEQDLIRQALWAGMRLVDDKVL
jgi:predicted DNA binding CopG/RHH family protein